MGGQGDLVFLGGLGTGGRQHPGVVNKHVQHPYPAAQVGGEGADGAEVGHVAHLHPHVGGRVGRNDLLPGPLTAVPVAHG